jgi:hypothetical protein
VRALRLAALAATLAVLALASAAHAAEPAKIQPPAGNAPYLLAHAVGVQSYACTATADGPTWQFVAPSAVLYDDRYRLVGIHFAGPTWQAKDGSQVVGQKVDGATVDPTAIPWLLLKAASTAAGPHGDTLASTSYIQRINTRGGLQPAAAACTAATLGAERHIPYTADYRFWNKVTA